MQESGQPANVIRDEETSEAHRREIGYAVLALVSLLIGIGRLADTTAPPFWVMVLDGGIAAAFLLDWIRRIRDAPRPRRYALRNSYEIVTFIPFTLLPAALGGGDVLRSVRLVRILRFMRFGRFAKVGLSLARLPRRARHLQRIVRNAQLANILLVGLLTVSLGAAILLFVERDAIGAQGYGAAFWWSLNIFTTAGYAVPAPRTPAGYLASGCIMVAGVSYIGVFTASLAGAILRTSREDEV